ncbi:hypothetical protein GJ744_006148 [Endocarpon pusillum]|uniref:Cytochrome P450 n=1 Tax=Endocarpon pusillum TaxID=364733 RepID=A0A8H7A461_9EURO|nr:hypothetical protein GJ744_006148 [Endocarpon pusillum]
MLGRGSNSQREPPFILPTVPFVGHLVGILLQKRKYFTSLSSKYRLSLYSLDLLGGRIYIVNSVDVLQLIQRLPKKLSFWFIEAKFGAKLAGLSKQAEMKLLDNPQGEKGDHSLLWGAMMAIHQNMKPGKSLDQMNQDMARHLTTILRDLDAEDGETVDLWEWVMHKMTLVTTESIYGPLNPFREKAVEDNFWDFSDNTAMLLAGFMPKIIARKGYKAREELVLAFEKYFAAAGPTTACNMIEAQWQNKKTHGISMNDSARLECVNSIAFLANTIPTAFWVVFHAFSNPTNLSRLREEASKLLIIQNDESGRIFRILDATRVRDNTFLVSFLEESLRLQALGAGNRYVVEDTLLDGRYLLKKDSLIIIPNEGFHSDPSIWGADPKIFDADRFLRLKGKKVNPASFRGFGGGANLCPGRFFAMTEVLTMVSVLALGYDLEPYSGRWSYPGEDHSNMSLIVPPPADKVVVRLRRRSGWEGGLWSVRYEV